MPTKKKTAAPVEVDWPAVLASGPDGAARWNARSVTARQMTRLSAGDFSGCDLSGVNFHGQPSLRFRGAGALFRSAVLSNAAFGEADLRNCDFTGATMTKFGARGSDMSGAKLAGVDLSSARLAEVKLVGADLSGADLTGADISGSDLTDANLEGATLVDMLFDQHTVWPAGFAVPAGARWKPEPIFDGEGKDAVAANVDALFARLQQTFDANRITRTREMLRAGTNQLFAEIRPDSVRGVVRSQREPDLVYSCLLREDGTYCCATPDLAECMGLRGEPCKHLLVLLLGLAKAGELTPQTADRWVLASRLKKHTWNVTLREEVADTLLRYRGAVAGEIDWRPTETIPEDFYAM
jgi:uncharacterized protein YjbI with pentapeptide repeats